MDEEQVDAQKAESDAKKLTKINSLTAPEFLNLIELSSKLQLKQIFTSYQRVF